MSKMDQCKDIGLHLIPAALERCRTVFDDMGHSYCLTAASKRVFRRWLGECNALVQNHTVQGEGARGKLPPPRRISLLKVYCCPSELRQRRHRGTTCNFNCNIFDAAFIPIICRLHFTTRFLRLFQGWDGRS